MGGVSYQNFSAASALDEMRDVYDEDMPSGVDVFTSDFGRKMYEILRSEHEKTGRIDLKLIMDGMSAGEAQLLQEIVDSVIIAGNEERVFNECVNTWKKQLLNRELDKINTLLDMADEVENQDRIKELMLRMMEIQKELKCL